MTAAHIEPTMRLIHLVRHGRTSWNVQHRVMGWLDEGIEPESEAAARETAHALGGAWTMRDGGAEPAIDVIVSSPLRRARQTAAPFAEMVGIEPRLDERAAELRVGPWEGLTEDEVARRWPAEWRRWRTEPHTLELTGRETLPALNHRVAELLDELTSDPDASGAAIVFTHDVVVRAAVAWALGLGPEIYRHVEVANCSITTVRVVDGVRRLVRANDVAHLGASHRESPVRRDCDGPDERASQAPSTS